MQIARPELTTAAVLRFWWPLASTWLLMAAEGLFLAAVLARLAAPRENLAAYGVAFAFAIIVEAPVIVSGERDGITVEACLQWTDSYHETIDRKSTRLNSSHTDISRMPSSA